MKKKRKIIFIAPEPLTQFTKKMYNIKEFLIAGFDVEYWDLHPFLYHKRSLPDEAKDSYIYLMNSFESFSERLNTIEVHNAIFILITGDNWKTRKIVHLLSDKKCKVITVNYYASANTNLSFLRIIKRAFYSNILKKAINLFNAYRYKFYKKTHNISPFICCFSTSFQGSDRINLPDYELYKKLKTENNTLVEESYILFIDVFYPLHPDLRDFGTDSPSNAVDYYSSMRLFFDNLEKKFNMPVIIAAHPKAIYNNNEFGNRKIIKYATGQLIQHADFIVLHASNSISFAVLFNKPVAFIKTAGMRTFEKFTFYISSAAQLFGKNVFNIDKQLFEDFSFSCIDSNIAENYINNYLTSPQTKDKSNDDILIQKINCIFNSTAT